MKQTLYILLLILYVSSAFSVQHRQDEDEYLQMCTLEESLFVAALEKLPPTAAGQFGVLNPQIPIGTPNVIPYVPVTVTPGGGGRCIGSSC
jgi:hypothetical protein